MSSYAVTGLSTAVVQSDNRGSTGITSWRSKEDLNRSGQITVITCVVVGGGGCQGCMCITDLTLLREHSLAKVSEHTHQESQGAREGPRENFLMNA